MFRAYIHIHISPKTGNNPGVFQGADKQWYISGILVSNKIGHTTTWMNL